MNTNSLRVRNDNNVALKKLRCLFIKSLFFVYLTILSSAAAAAAGVQSDWVAEREHLRRVSQVTPRQCHHWVPLLVNNFPFDLGPKVQIADEGDSVKGQRQQE